MSDNKQVDTTGHVWDDDLREFNNPLPKWWLYTYYATIVFAVIYWVLYPAWPLVSDYTRGTLGWSQLGELKQEQEEAKVLQGKYKEKLAGLAVADIMKDPETRAFAVSTGKAIFGDKCAPCHGSAGQGKVGLFPNLTDDDWLYGGDAETILASINEGRQGMMPAQKGVLSDAQITNVTDYVLSMSGGQVDAASAAAGKEVFAASCAMCHGEDGKGNPAMGAPNLADKIWLYGGDKENVLKTITDGRSGLMPTFKAKLDAIEIKQVAVYVHQLGGGQM